MEDDKQTKGEKMDEAPDAYVAEDLYEDERRLRCRATEPRAGGLRATYFCLK